MTEITTLHYLVVAASLFIVGTIGVLTRRNVVIILMSIELILNAVNLNLALLTARDYPNAVTELGLAEPPPAEEGDVLQSLSLSVRHSPAHPRLGLLPRPARLPEVPLPQHGAPLAVSALPRVEHVRRRTHRPRRS